MKLFYFILLFFCYTFSVAQQSSKDSFLLAGKTNIPYANYIYFKYVNKIGKTVYDSTTVISNRFFFKGNVNLFYKKALIYFKNRTLKYTELTIGLENKEIKVNLDLNEIKKSKVFGNNSEILISSFYKQKTRKLNTLKKIQRKQKTISKTDSLKLKLEYTKLKFEISKFCKKNPQSNISTFLIFDNKNLFTDEEILSLYENLSLEQQKSYYGKYLEKSVTEYKLQSSQIGLQVNNFFTLDYRGSKIELFEYTKKGVVLLDFWASWCSPCRESHPFLRKIYQTYHHLGLEIISISADKQIDELKWKDAIMEDSIYSWVHILTNPANFEKSNSRLDLLPDYKIQFFPTQILIDKQNKIIARIEDEEQLANKLKEIYGNQTN